MYVEHWLIRYHSYKPRTMWFLIFDEVMSTYWNTISMFNACLFLDVYHRINHPLGAYIFSETVREGESEHKQGEIMPDIQIHINPLWGDV